MPLDREREDIEGLLLQTLVGETGRHRRARIAWRRTGPDAWDLYRPGACTCGRPDLPGLGLNGAAAVIVARLEALDAPPRGGMQRA